LRPWDNISEEDLFRVDGLYLSIRGNVRAPEGVWCTSSQANAGRWIAAPDAEPEDSDWVYDAGSQQVTKSGLPTERVEKAIDKVLNQFEGKPHDGVEFPIWLNPGQE
jgi:hypothetical protein